MQRQPAMTPARLIAKWRPYTGGERAGYQSFFNDLCAVAGHSTPVEMDPSATWFCFERYNKAISGKRGFADVYKENFFAWECKGNDADLDETFKQLQRYREQLKNPHLLVVSTFQKIIVRTNFNNTVPSEKQILIEDLANPAVLSLLRNIFHNPDSLRPNLTPAKVTENTAALFGDVADRMRQRGVDPEQAARYLNRIVFCLFAEDTGLLPDKLMTGLCQRHHADPQTFDGRLQELFQCMANGGDFGLSEIPRFNGDLFSDAVTIPLSDWELEKIAESCEEDWSHIEPSIFGTLFERSLDPDKRSQIGAHYTSPEDIVLVVKPVLMEPLIREWG